MNKKNIITLLTLTIIIFSCNNNVKKEYYSNGNLKIRYQTDRDGLIHGNYEEFYDDGYSIKKKTKFESGINSDTAFYFYENGKIKYKGLEIDGNPVGWWDFFDNNGLLTKKYEFRIIENEAIINQKIQYYPDGEINYTSSSFFEIKIDDTLTLGANKATVNFYSSFKDYISRYMYVIVENQYSESLIKKDTFTDDIDKLWFGIYAHKKGNLMIEGVIEEKLVYYNEASIDSTELRIRSIYKYFEKEVYVKDTVK